MTFSPLRSSLPGEISLTPGPTPLLLVWNSCLPCTLMKPILCQLETSSRPHASIMASHYCILLELHSHCPSHTPDTVLHPEVLDEQTHPADVQGICTHCSQRQSPNASHLSACRVSYTNIMSFDFCERQVVKVVRSN